MKRLAIAAAALLGVSCGDTPTVIPARNLERPSDMAFLCLAAAPDAGVLTGRPMRVCHPPESRDPCRVDLEPDDETCKRAPSPAQHSPRTLGTFAAVTNTARGELSMVDMDRGRLVDVDPSAPGFGTVPVGAMPEFLAASQDGCWVATANRESCDLALVDPAQLLSPLFADLPAASQSSAASPVVRRVRPHTASGRVLRASPREIAFLPSPAQPGLCAADRAPMAVVTFPTCDLVALIELPSGRIASSYYLRAAGAVPAGAEPVCPTDCAGEDALSLDAAVPESPVPGAGDGGAAGEVTSPGAGAPEPTDAGPLGLPDTGAAASPAAGGAADGGVAGAAASPATGDAADGGVAGAAGLLGVGALALSPDGRRLYVGASRAGFISVFDVVSGSLAERGRIALAENPGGVDRLRLSVDPWKLRFEASSGDVAGQGDFLAGRGRFLYAFARDNSLRVVQIDTFLPELGQECDVNIVPDEGRLRQAGLTLASACIPVGTPGIARRALASGPGITIPVLTSQDLDPPLARDLAFADLQVPAGAANTPEGLVGQFAFLLGSNGAVHVLNLDPHDVSEEAPDDVADGQRTPLTHSFREFRAAGDSAADPPGATVTPQRVQSATDLLFPTSAPLSTNTGPRLDSFKASSNGTARTWAGFPDPTVPVSHRWTIAWEALLPGTARDSGTLLPGDGPNSAGVLADAGGDFCGRGVLAGDVVMLPGCLHDADCVPQDQFVCRRGVGNVRGLCLPKGSARGEALVEACARFLGSRRRYEVLSAQPTRLTLGSKLDEVPRPSECAIDDKGDGSADKECRPTPAHEGFRCTRVSGRNRCVQPCSQPGTPAGDEPCRPGHVCEEIAGAGSFCVEAPPVDPACWPQPAIGYTVHAGRSFLVTGSALPQVRTARLVDGQCQPDPDQPSDRIPLSAPKCTNISDGTDASPGTTTSEVLTRAEPPVPNPCQFTAKVEEQSSGGGTSPSADSHVKVAFQNPQIRFVMTNVDEYGGDGLTIRLDVSDGTVPLTVTAPAFEVLLTQGVRILLGPTRTPDSPALQNDALATSFYPYLYVVDQGRTALTPNSRGQILRIDPRRRSSYTPAFSSTLTGDAVFHIQ